MSKALTTSIASHTPKVYEFSWCSVSRTEEVMRVVVWSVDERRSTSQDGKSLGS